MTNWLEIFNLAVFNNSINNTFYNCFVFAATVIIYCFLAVIKGSDDNCVRELVSRGAVRKH